MELPKNITQIGETDHSCKIYVEDYVISYIKQLNRYAKDKQLAVALYGTRKEEGGVAYLFFYGACQLNFLQRESRHLSQAVQQESEELRQKYFPQHTFLGYRLLNGEMVEGFHVCEQGTCRYIAGYAKFYEKNDSMLAFMLENRRETAKPEEVDQEKYEEVKKRQEERRQQSGGQALPRREKITAAAQDGAKNLRNLKYAAAAVFVLLFVAGFAAMNSENGLEGLQTAARQMISDVNTQQLPDAMEVANDSAQVGTIVTEDKLTEALLQENAAAQQAAQESAPVPSAVPTSEPVPGTAAGAMPEPSPSAAADPTSEPSPSAAADPTSEPSPSAADGSTSESSPGTAAPAQEPTPKPAAEPVSYVIKRGDTLIGICIAQYGTDKKVAEIRSFNGITDPDDIKVGQKILLP